VPGKEINVTCTYWAEDAQARKIVVEMLADEPGERIVNAYGCSFNASSVRLFNLHRLQSETHSLFLFQSYDEGS